MKVGFPGIERELRGRRPKILLSPVPTPPKRPKRPRPIPPVRAPEPDPHRRRHHPPPEPKRSLDFEHDGTRPVHPNERDDD